MTQLRAWALRSTRLRKGRVGRRLLLWGDVPTTLPTWFTDTFPAAYQATRLFDSTLPAAAGLAPLPGCGRSDLPVSAPERAVLDS